VRRGFFLELRQHVSDRQGLPEEVSSEASKVEEVVGDYNPQSATGPAQQNLARALAAAEHSKL
jgi:hypothetical protein